MEKQILYKYNQMELEQFALFEENYAQDIEEVQYQTEVQFAYDHKNLIICCKMSSTMTFEGKPLLKTVLNSYFDISETSIKELTEDETVTFPPFALIQFASLSYGTMRGIIFAKTTGTPVNRLILPPMFFNEVIKNGYSVKM